MNRKGISPLIATVLILGFTVALAAIIMTWGTSFTRGIQAETEEQTTAQIKCATDIDLKMTCTCSDAGTASTGTEIDQCKYRIINNKASTIEKIRTRFFDVDGVFLGTTESQSLGLAGWAASSEYMKNLDSGVALGKGIKIEVLVEEATISGALMECGSAAVFEDNCNI